MAFLFFHPHFNDFFHKTFSSQDKPELSAIVFSDPCNATLQNIVLIILITFFLNSLLHCTKPLIRDKCSQKTKFIELLYPLFFFIYVDCITSLYFALISVFCHHFGLFDSQWKNGVFVSVFVGFISTDITDLF